jgi:hypothetical protein
MSLHLLEINLLKESFEIPAPILAIIDIKSVEDPGEKIEYMIGVTSLNKITERISTKFISSQVAKHKA